MRDAWNDRKFLCPAWASASILVVIVRYNFQNIMRENW